MDPVEAEDFGEWCRKITLKIRELWNDPNTTVGWTGHVEKNMWDRSISTAHVGEAIEFGGVETPSQPSDKLGFKKYRLDSFTEGSDNRRIGVVVEVDFVNRILNIITAMWIDESQTRAGTLR